MKKAVSLLKIAVVCILLCAACSKESIEEPPVIEGVSVPEFEFQLLVQVNEHRSTLGLSQLQLNPAAYDEASEHNDYMIGRGNISHDNFEQRASSIAAETSAEKVSENVARNHQTVDGALEGWLNSTPHKNTIEGDFTQTAISIKRDGNNNIYYTQIFIKE